MSEVKIELGVVEGQLLTMTHATNALNPMAEQPITGNRLDVVTHLTELSTRLEQLLALYQSILINNIATTQRSVEYMQEADELVSTRIRGASPFISK